MNILYILLDQIRKDMLGAYGHQIVKTPNMTVLLKTVFALITPSHPHRLRPCTYLVFTGLMPSTHGIIRNGEKGGTGEIAQSAPNIGKLEGYNTYVVGKWHVGRNLCQKIMAFKDIILMAMATLAAACIKTLCLINHQLTPIAIKSGWKKKAMRFQR